MTTQTVHLYLTKDTEAGKVRVLLSFEVLPGQRHLVILGQKTPREVLSSDVRAELRRKVTELSGGRT